MQRLPASFIASIFTVAIGGIAWPSLAVTVLSADRAVEIEATLADPNDLWVHPDDLPKINGFVLKPEGACLDDICVPVQRAENNDIYLERKGRPWFNVSELADRLQQPYVNDIDTNLWSFGAIPVQRQGFVREGLAPDFTLPDWHGNPVSLSDFKGKKIMLLTWASW